MEMATGYFPLQPTDEEGAKLIQAIRLIDEVRGELLECTSLNCTPEDSAQDGEYLSHLSNAIKEIGGCLDGYASHRAVCLKVIDILNSYLPPDSGIDPHDCITEILGVLDGPMWRSAERGYPEA
jgi:hypothetical protein